MGQFDQTGRQMAKLDGAAFVAWGLSCCAGAPDVTFGEWDDMRRLVAPGEPDRVNDLVARIRDLSGPRRQAWLIAEIEEEAKPGTLLRIGQYEMLLAQEVGLEAAILSLVVNLTGSQKRRELRWDWGEYGTRVRPLVVDVAAQDGPATLGRIESGELGLTALPFLALMKGSGSAAFITGWKRVVETEPDAERRRLFRDWAVVMSDLTRWQVEWRKATEGWMARESPTINGWIKEGRELGELDTQRKNLMRLIERKLKVAVPDSIRLAVEGTTDMAKLQEWFDLAVEARGLAQLRRAIQAQEPAPQPPTGETGR